MSHRTAVPRRVSCPYHCGWSGAPSRQHAHNLECRGRRLALEIGDARAARIQGPAAGRTLARRLVAAGLAGTALLAAVPAGAQTQPGTVPRCTTADGRIVGANTPDALAPGVVCTPQQVVECWVPQPSEVVGGRQRADGTWETRVYAGADDSNVQGAGCVEILPGVWVAEADADAVTAYLWHLATQGTTDERLVPALDWYVWDQIAGCESRWTWNIRGRTFDGGLQIAHSTWRAYGGAEFAARPADATREQQIVVARNVLTDAGWGAWPGCSRALGYR